MLDILYTMSIPILYYSITLRECGSEVVHEMVEQNVVLSDHFNIKKKLDRIVQESIMSVRLG